MQQRVTSSAPSPTALITPNTEEHQHWPEPLRDALRLEEPFPWRVILPWIGGSSLLLVLLLAMWGYLMWRAGHQILFLNSAGNLTAIHADGSSARQVTFANLNGARFGPPQWAHDGRRFAALARHNGTIKVVIARPGSDSPTLVEDSAVRFQSLPPAAWSVDDTRLAVVGNSDTQGQIDLVLIDSVQSQFMAVDAALIPQTPLAWHPRESRLLITSYTSAFTPTLRVVGPDGTSTELTPPDAQLARSFGAWSPDGGRIAYVAITGSGESGLAGSIWTANSDGSNPQQIVNDGLNLAPIWSPAGDAIFFTRWLTQTDSYDLYRATADGSSVTRISAVIPYAAADGRPLLEWSPDRSKLFFQNHDRSTGATTIWIANGDGSNPQSVLAIPTLQEYLPVRWAPTGRALLFVMPEGDIILHWIDAQRAETRLAAGNAPDWQP